MPEVTRVNRSLAVYEVSHYALHPSLVKRAWDHSSKLWSIYGYTPPRINRSFVEAGGVTSPHDREIAWLNFAEKRVTVNLHRLERLGLDLLPAIFTHELGHKLIPGDLKTLLLMISAVKEEIKSDEGAAMVSNLFQDMVLNVEGHRRGEQGLHELYVRAWEKEPDTVQKVLGRAYEKLYQRNDLSRRYYGTIIREPMEAKLEADAQQIHNIIIGARRNNWLESAREFARVIGKHAESMGSERIYSFTSIRPEDFSPEKKSPIPPQGAGDREQLQKRLGGTIYDLGQLEKPGKDKHPCSLDRFKQFLEDSRINTGDLDALIWYYRDLIGGKVVKVPEVQVHSGSLYPYAVKTWQPGDSPQQLDWMLSKSVGGLVIPGHTTKKWVSKSGQHVSIGRDYPDLDLWIDSSGSMQDPQRGISHAVAAGMIVSKSFLSTRKKVRVLNWASEGQVVSTKGFIEDEYEVDRILTYYHRGSTELPLDEIEKPYQKGGRQKYIVMISDLGIFNVDQAVIDRLTNVFQNSVGGTIFLIGQEDARLIDIFKGIGFDVVPVKDVSDLDQHALQLTKELFEGRLTV